MAMPRTSCVLRDVSVRPIAKWKRIKKEQWKLQNDCFCRCTTIGNSLSGLAKLETSQWPGLAYILWFSTKQTKLNQFSLFSFSFWIEMSSIQFSIDIGILLFSHIWARMRWKRHFEMLRWRTNHFSSHTGWNWFVM